jgi:hypothetical protein
MRAAVEVVDLGPGPMSRKRKRGADDDIMAIDLTGDDDDMELEVLELPPRRSVGECCWRSSNGCMLNSRLALCSMSPRCE